MSRRCEELRDAGGGQQAELLAASKNSARSFMNPRDPVTRVETPRGYR